MLEISQLRETGTSFCHVLPHGERVPMHRHTRAHLLYPVSGVVAMTTARGTSITPASRAAWTPAGYYHEHCVYGRTDIRILYIPVSHASRLPNEPVVMAISPLVREIILALTGRQDDTSDTWRRLREVAIDEIAAAPRDELLQLPEPRDRRLRSLTQLLHGDPACSATLAELGRIVGASERNLSRLFQLELGMSFRQWRTQLRVHHSLVLLTAGRNIAETSAACGWANSSSFIEAFSEIIGRTPGRYQADLRG